MLFLIVMVFLIIMLFLITMLFLIIMLFLVIMLFLIMLFLVIILLFGRFLPSEEESPSQGGGILLLRGERYGGVLERRETAVYAQAEKI